MRPISFYYCFMRAYGFLYVIGADIYLEGFAFLSLVVFATLLVLLIFTLFFLIGTVLILELLPIFGWDAPRFIFLLLADFYNLFF